MLICERALTVKLSHVHLKTDKEGGKWATCTLTLKVEDPKVLRGALAQGYELLRAATSFEKLMDAGTMSNVQIEFQNGVGRGAPSVFEPRDLFSFAFQRESSTQAGTLKKDRGVGVELEFKFTVNLAVIGAWALANFGDEVVMTLHKVQGELPIGDENSQEARNARIVEAEAKDSPPETVSAAPAKKGRKKKAA
jgi:hypothetical protein